MGDFTKYHPWRAPGHAKTADPCGMAGAYLSPASERMAPEGSKPFVRGSELPVGVRTEWRAGNVVEVGWMLGSNHGGGYLYSLCPAGEPLTEKCFQMGTLPFVGHTHTIRYLDNKTNGQQNQTEVIIPATDVSEGTWPTGSAWRLNPIPACNCDRGDSCLAQNDTDIDLLKACKDTPFIQTRISNPIALASAPLSCSLNVLGRPPSVHPSAPLGSLARAFRCGRRHSLVDVDEGPPQPKGEAGAGNDCPTGTQFPVPFPYGYGMHLWYNKEDGQ